MGRQTGAMGRRRPSLLEVLLVLCLLADFPTIHAEGPINMKHINMQHMQHRAEEKRLLKELSQSETHNASTVSDIAKPYLKLRQEDKRRKADEVSKKILRLDMKNDDYN